MHLNCYKQLEIAFIDTTDICWLLTVLATHFSIIYSFVNKQLEQIWDIDRLNKQSMHTSSNPIDIQE